LAKLEFDVSIKDGGLKELNKLIREQKQLTSELIQQYGKESDAAKKSGLATQQLTKQKQELNKATNQLSGGIKKSAAQLLEMGENITVVLAGLKSVAGGMFNFGKTAITSAANFEELRSHFKGAESDIYAFQKATAFTTSKSDLIKLSNQAADLGIELSKQPMFFLLAKDAAEKYGTDLSTAFQGVVLATEGNIRGLKQIGIQKEVYKKIVADLTKEMGGEVEMTSALNGEQEINIKNLDPLTQKNIRLEAVLKATGVSMEDVNKKTQSNADKLAQLDLLIPQVQKQFGELLAGAIIPLSDELRNTEGKFNSIAVATAGFGMVAGELLPTLAALKIAFASTFTAAAVAVGKVAGAIAILAMNINNAIQAFNALKAVFSGEIMNYARQSWAGRNLYGLDQTNSETNAQNEVGVFEGIKNRLRQVTELRSKLSGLTTRQTGVNIPSNQSRGGNTAREQTEKEILNAYEQQLQVIQKIEDELVLNFGLTGKILQLNGELIKAKQELRFIETGINLKDLGIVSQSTSPTNNLPTYEGGTSFIQSKSIEVIIQGISEPFMNVADGIKSTFSDLMNTLNLETDSFVGQLVSGFDRVLSVVNMIVNAMNTINAVKGLIGGIMSIIPGGSAVTALAGGMAGGMPMPMLQSGNSRPIVNVVVQSEVEKTKAIKFFDNNFNAYQNYLRSNSY